MVKSELRICGSADVDIDKLELNFIFRLRVSVRVRVGVRVRVSISIYLITVIKLRIGSVLTNNIRKSANPQSAFYPWPSRHVKYDLRKFSFSRTLWNSLPDTVVEAESVNSFKARLDRFWNDQEVKYNWKADIKGTGSRSNV